MISLGYVILHFPSCVLISRTRTSKISNRKLKSKQGVFCLFHTLVVEQMNRKLRLEFVADGTWPSQSGVPTSYSLCIFMFSSDSACHIQQIVFFGEESSISTWCLGFARHRRYKAGAESCRCIQNREEESHDDMVD